MPPITEPVRALAFDPDSLENTLAWAHALNAGVKADHPLKVQENYRSICREYAAVKGAKISGRKRVSLGFDGAISFAPYDKDEFWYEAVKSAHLDKGRDLGIPIGKAGFTRERCESLNNGDYIDFTAEIEFQCTLVGPPDPEALKGKIRLLIYLREFQVK